MGKWVASRRLFLIFFIFLATAAEFATFCATFEQLSSKAMHPSFVSPLAVRSHMPPRFWLTSTNAVGKTNPPQYSRFPLKSKLASCGRRRFTYFSSISSTNEDGKVRTLFLGTPEVAAESLKTIYNVSLQPESMFEIVGVVTQPPRRRKRKGKIIPSPVALVADELGVPVLSPEKAKDPDFLKELEEVVRPDLCITAAYGQYLPKRFLALPRFGTVNIHPSLLPRWRGASPVQRSLEAGDNPVGVSVLFTVSKMDAGPIISQNVVHIDENDQATKVLPHLFKIGTEALLTSLPEICSGSITMDSAQRQDEDGVLNASMIESSEGELCVWNESALTCHNRVRGFSMWPGTFMYFRIGEGESEEPLKIKVATTRVLKETSEPTDVVVLGPKKGDGLRVVCGDGSILELLQVQPVTKKVMDAKSFVNGLRSEPIRWVQIPQDDDSHAKSEE